MHILKPIFKSLLCFVVLTALAAQAQAQLKTYQFTGISTSGNAGSMIVGEITLDLGAVPDECDAFGGGGVCFWYNGNFAIDAITDTGAAAGTNTTPGGETRFLNVDIPAIPVQHTRIDYENPVEEDIFYYVHLRGLSFTEGDGEPFDIPDPWDPLAAEEVSEIEIVCIDRYADKDFFGQFQIVSFTAVVDPEDVLDGVIDEINDLLDAGDISGGQANALTSKIENALKSLDKGNENAAVNQLNALKNQVNALLNSGALSQAEADALLDQICLAIDSIEEL